MITKLLIANRGEIACRVIKTAKRMGIRTVAVYSDADQTALHVRLADEAVYLGESPAKLSYLNAAKIITIALKVGADAIHPGYGFLSENARFAGLCAQNNIVFVGPPIGAIEAMGSKSAAKHIMQQANVPLVPGYHGDEQSAEILQAEADKMGYPVLLKAAAGGGGKGMRQVWQASEFTDALDAAKREAMSSFNDELMLVEKYLTQPRHVEIQVFCDSHGNGVYLFERDCSVQRRHQKVIEEAPAPGLDGSLRQQMGEAALTAAKAINYVGAGTVEFLLDVDGSFYFMEMNTRLQVEHPVTEMITGQDLVEWQLRVANGEPLPLTQQQLSIKGHAFEARIYAEDPNNEFLPSTGRIQLLQMPEESEYLRIDTGIVEGDDVSVYYDPMLAKLIVWDENRDKALSRMTRALSEFHVEGLSTNLEFLYNLVSCDAFKQADIDTGFIEKHQQHLFVDIQPELSRVVPMAALVLMLKQDELAPSQQSDPFSPWQQNSGWRANELHQQTIDININGQNHQVKVKRIEQGRTTQFEVLYQQHSFICTASFDGQQLLSTINGHKTRITVANNHQGFSLFSPQGVVRVNEIRADLGLNDESNQVANFAAPMNGTVVAILVDANEMVAAGQSLIVIEAMKMEHAIKASEAGKVTEFYYAVGQLVDGGAELLAFSPQTPAKKEAN
ncbi:acetyl/propionyl/methylcrotonyl-CoA carboxylase subunit alpha [Paraglaciecola hydrolytica]|uniref:Biotin carboxylase n=1 Tax=Paraglaciecola hydrolytica TaxID=1799789 RepID=A0A136A427_9ALTE|nr:acetyl/propionyl/methylcrotonyl-CoA carboxylase subunit alpha [Paraglaciecola hydrolytica]KXI29992.1 3-methylcrotonyl-CoA carboxylase [Paraglaciecola hydrolytica]